MKIKQRSVRGQKIDTWWEQLKMALWLWDMTLANSMHKIKVSGSGYFVMGFYDKNTNRERYHKQLPSPRSINHVFCLFSPWLCDNLKWLTSVSRKTGPRTNQGILKTMKEKSWKRRAIRDIGSNNTWKIIAKSKAPPYWQRESGPFTYMGSRAQARVLWFKDKKRWWNSKLNVKWF